MPTKMLSTKLLSGLLAALMAIVLHVPTLVHKSALVALSFLVLDTLTGYMCAFFDRNWSSHMMRVKLVAKVSQYMLLLGSCAGAAVLAGSWSFLVAGWWAMIAIEAHSNIENAIKLQAFGVDLGPASPLLDKLSTFFSADQVTNSSQATTLTSAAKYQMVSSDPSAPSNQAPSVPDKKDTP